MSISPVDKTPPPQAPAPAPASPPPRAHDHDGDSDDGAGGVKPSLDKGVGENVDKTA